MQESQDEQQQHLWSDKETRLQLVSLPWGSSCSYIFVSGRSNFHAAATDIHVSPVGLNSVSTLMTAGCDGRCHALKNNNCALTRQRVSLQGHTGCSHGFVCGRSKFVKSKSASTNGPLRRVMPRPFASTNALLRRAMPRLEWRNRVAVLHLARADKGQQHCR